MTRAKRDIIAMILMLTAFFLSLVLIHARVERQLETPGYWKGKNDFNKTRETVYFRNAIDGILITPKGRKYRIVGNRNESSLRLGPDGDIIRYVKDGKEWKDLDGSGLSRQFWLNKYRRTQG